MGQSYDVLVVGSGFGGAVMAYRLSQKGYRVLVMERGKRWSPDDYPRKPGDQWFYDPDEPARQHGWIDLRFFRNMMVAQGAGVGGGSLIYANVSVDAPAQAFNQHWPEEIKYPVLQPYYEEVGRMLDLQELPDNQLTRRYELMREAARKEGFQDRFRKVPLAVSFSADFSYDLEHPIDPAHSKPFTNRFGRQQGTCVHLGNCDLGCDVQAKNTLDLNYLAAAENAGCEIRPLHIVQAIQAKRDGFLVHYQWIDTENESLVSESLEVAKVVLAAGSLGSTEILLRSREQYKTLPDISSRLGQGWSANGDFLTPARHGDREINPTQGPTISSAIDFLDADREAGRFFIEDGGIPDLRSNFASEKWGGLHRHWRYKLHLKALQLSLGRRNKRPPLENWMLWFAQGVDAADGRLRLRRKWFKPWQKKLTLDWDIKRSEPLIDNIVEMHKRLADATGADFKLVPPTWRWFKDLVTPHALGGCNMGRSAEDGVVDHLGRVFNYPGLYVTDGAIVPAAIGLNPSKTIAALAERCADHFEDKGD